MRPLSPREQSMVLQTLPCGHDRTLVLLDYPEAGAEQSAEEINANLLCLNGEGGVVWRVKPPRPAIPSGDPFVGVDIDGATATATRFSGDTCEINLRNGLATKVGWTK